MLCLMIGEFKRCSADFALPSHVCTQSEMADEGCNCCILSPSDHVLVAGGDGFHHQFAKKALLWQTRAGTRLLLAHHDSEESHVDVEAY